MRVEISIMGERGSGKTRLAEALFLAIEDFYRTARLETDIGRLLQQRELTVTIDAVTVQEPHRTKERVGTLVLARKVVVERK